jgi:predicted Zn-dependent protease
MKNPKRLVLPLLFALSFLVACSTETVSQERQRPREPERSRTAQRVNPRDAERLERIMIPLLRAANNPRDPREVKVGIIAEDAVNAANAGGGEFYVTTGLLERASDSQLRGILAHEIAHDDLGHVARAQILGVGLNLGVVLLEQLIPGSSAITPIAGTLVARRYSRSEELAADRHGVEILERAGYSKDTLINALAWVSRESGGNDGGGFLATHPATSDRIDALKRLS